jgi:hypothetical protein
MARHTVIAVGNRRRIVAAGRSSGRGGAAWRARKRTRGGKLGRQMAWRRCVDAIRVNNGTGGAAAAMSYGGDGKELPAARAAAWRARGGPAGGAKVVGELGGDAWSGAGAGVGLGRHGNGSGRRRCRTAEEAEEEEEQGALGADLQNQEF